MVMALGTKLPKYSLLVQLLKIPRINRVGMTGNYVSYFHNEDIFYLLTLKRLRGCAFSKNVTCKERMKP